MGATTIYLNNTPDRVNEGESMNLSFNGWTSEPDHFYSKVHGRFGLGNPDVIATGEVSVNDGHFVATAETENIATATVKDRIRIWVKADSHKSDHHHTEVDD